MTENNIEKKYNEELENETLKIETPNLEETINNIQEAYSISALQALYKSESLFGGTIGKVKTILGLTTFDPSKLTNQIQEAKKEKESVNNVSFHPKENINENEVA